MTLSTTIKCPFCRAFTADPIADRPKLVKVLQKQVSIMYTILLRSSTLGIPTPLKGESELEDGMQYVINMMEEQGLKFDRPNET